MPLVGAVVDERIPSTGEPYPYLHTFFRMGDGACLRHLPGSSDDGRRRARRRHL
jgi:hypothetical protein